MDSKNWIGLNSILVGKQFAAILWNRYCLHQFLGIDFVSANFWEQICHRQLLGTDMSPPTFGNRYVTANFWEQICHRQLLRTYIISANFVNKSYLGQFQGTDLISANIWEHFMNFGIDCFSANLKEQTNSSLVTANFRNEYQRSFRLTTRRDILVKRHFLILSLQLRM